MRLEINMMLYSDDGKCSRSVANGIAVLTDVPGLDPSVAKQDFMQQADALFRVTSESQLPALYDAVEREREGDCESPKQSAGKKGRGKEGEAGEGQ